MRTVESWNSKETVEKRSVNVGFALQVRRMIQLPPGYILVSVKAPLSGSTRFASNVGWTKSRKGTTARVSCVLNVAPIISYSFLPLRHFFDFLTPWTSWLGGCAQLLRVECVSARSTGLVSLRGQLPSCR